MRRKLDFNDWWLGTLAVLFLTLTVTVLYRLMQMPPGKQLVVATTFFVGVATLWMLLQRPAMLRDTPRQGFDLRDLLMAMVGFLCSFLVFQTTFRWSSLSMTVHQVVMIAALEFLTIFSFYCIAQRAGLARSTTGCISLAGLLFMEGLWKLTKGSRSPLYYYISTPKEEGYPYLACGAVFLFLALVFHTVRRRRDRASRSLE